MARHAIAMERDENPMARHENPSTEHRLGLGRHRAPMVGHGPELTVPFHAITRDEPRLTSDKYPPEDDKCRGP
jgi:hypothetical protein